MEIVISCRTWLFVFELIAVAHLGDRHGFAMREFKIFLSTRTDRMSAYQHFNCISGLSGLAQKGSFWVLRNLKKLNSMFENMSNIPKYEKLRIYQNGRL